VALITTENAGAAVARMSFKCGRRDGELLEFGVITTRIWLSRARASTRGRPRDLSICFRRCRRARDGVDPGGKKQALDERVTMPLLWRELGFADPGANRTPTAAVLRLSYTASPRVESAIRPSDRVTR
jgi:hypothetical protein